MNTSSLFCKRHDSLQYIYIYVQMKSNTCFVVGITDWNPECIQLFCITFDQTWRIRGACIFLLMIYGLLLPVLILTAGQPTGMLLYNYLNKFFTQIILKWLEFLVKKGVCYKATCLFYAMFTKNIWLNRFSYTKSSCSF